MSASAQFDISDIDRAAREAVGGLSSDAHRLALQNLKSDTDIFDLLDSFAIVELLLATETSIEAMVGRYVPLGDESLLDASKSPLHRFGRWLEYISHAISHG